MLSLLPNWGFRATKTIHELKKPVEIKGKDGSVTNLNSLVSKLPSLSTSSKLMLHPLLFNGIFQTMYYASSNGQDRFKVWYGREIFHFEDGGICSLDWVKDEEPIEQFKETYKQTLPENWPRLLDRTRFFSKKELEQREQLLKNDTKPLVVILHGLAGGSHEALVRNFAELLTTGKNKDKFDVVVNLSRGCGRTKITNAKLFNAFSTGDVHEVLTDLKLRCPNRPIYAVGFSFGACLLTNYLGDYPEESAQILKAAAIVGCVFDLKKSAEFLESTWSGVYLFNKAVSSYLNRLVKSNLKELRGHDPVLFSEENVQKARKATRSRDFDDVFTCKVSGHANAMEYYEAGSPVKKIGKVNVPLLSLSAKDDPTVGPFIPVDVMEANANIVSVETDLGGHLAFVTPNKEFWCVRVVDEFIEAMEETK